MGQVEIRKAYKEQICDALKSPMPKEKEVKTDALLEALKGASLPQLKRIHRKLTRFEREWDDLKKKRDRLLAGCKFEVFRSEEGVGFKFIQPKGVPLERIIKLSNAYTSRTLRHSLFDSIFRLESNEPEAEGRQVHEVFFDVRGARGKTRSEAAEYLRANNMAFAPTSIIEAAAALYWLKEGEDLFQGLTVRTREGGIAYFDRWGFAGIGCPDEGYTSKYIVTSGVKSSCPEEEPAAQGEAAVPLAVVIGAPLTPEGRFAGTTALFTQMAEKLIATGFENYRAASIIERVEDGDGTDYLEIACKNDKDLRICAGWDGEHGGNPASIQTITLVKPEEREIRLRSKESGPDLTFKEASLARIIVALRDPEDSDASDVYLVVDDILRARNGEKLPHPLMAFSESNRLLEDPKARRDHGLHSRQLIVFEADPEVRKDCEYYCATRGRKPRVPQREERPQSPEERHKLYELAGQLKGKIFLVLPLDERRDPYYEDADGEYGFLICSSLHAVGLFADDVDPGEELLLFDWLQNERLRPRLEKGVVVVCEKEFAEANREAIAEAAATQQIEVGVVAVQKGKVSLLQLLKDAASPD